MVFSILATKLRLPVGLFKKYASQRYTKVVCESAENLQKHLVKIFLAQFPAVQQIFSPFTKTYQTLIRILTQQCQLIIRINKNLVLDFSTRKFKITLGIITLFITSSRVEDEILVSYSGSSSSGVVYSYTFRVIQ